MLAGVLAATVGASPLPSAAGADRVPLAVAAASCQASLNLTPQAPADSPFAPPQSVLAAYAVLRRAATPADALPTFNDLAAVLAEQLGRYEGTYIRRVAQLASGVQIFIIPGTVARRPVVPLRCIPRAERLAYKRAVAHERALSDAPEYCLVEVGSATLGSPPSQCATFAAARSGGGFGSLDDTPTATPTLAGVVPDGVAAVQIDFPHEPTFGATVAENAFTGRASFGFAAARARRFASDLRHTGRAAGRRVQADLRALQALATPSEVRWLSASGAVIARLHPRESVVPSIAELGLVAGSSGSFSGSFTSTSSSAAAAAVRAAGSAASPPSRTTSCSSAPASGQPSPNGAPLPAAILARYAVLRRAPRAADQIPPLNDLAFTLANQLASFDTGYLRLLADLGGGRQAFLIPGMLAVPPLPPAGCLPPEQLASLERTLAPARRRAQLPSYCVAVTGDAFPSGRSDVCLPFADDADGYAIANLAASSAGGFATLGGLVPDGVATVELYFRHHTVVRAPASDNFMLVRTRFPLAVALQRQGSSILAHASHGGLAPGGPSFKKLGAIERALAAATVPFRVRWLDAAGAVVGSFAKASASVADYSAGVLDSISFTSTSNGNTSTSVDFLGG